jgi:hypothetical protein
LPIIIYGISVTLEQYMQLPNLEHSKALADLAKASAWLVAAAAFLLAVLFGRSLAYNTKEHTLSLSPGKAINQPGDPGAPRPGSTETVWLADCPTDTEVVSGMCVVYQSPAPVSLQNVGIHPGNKWNCTWSGPVTKAEVKALCAKLK